MEPLLLKGLQWDFPTNCELLWDVKLKNWALEEKRKNIETKTGTSFTTGL